MRYSIVAAALAAVVVSACGGDDEPGNDDTNRGGDTLTVNGTVYSSQQTVVPSVVVRVYSAGADTAVTTATDAQGAFSVSDVTTPYDVVITDQGSPNVFIGVTESEPKLGLLSGFATSLPRSTIATGAVAGTFAGADHYVLAETDISADTDRLNANDDSYSIATFTPPGAATLNAAIRALSVTRDGDAISGFQGYFQQATVLQAGVSNTFPVNLTPAGDNRLFTIRGNAPGGVALYRADLIWLGAGHAFVSLDGFTSFAAGSSTVSMVKPQNEAIQLAARVVAAEGSSLAFAKLSVDDNAVEVELPAPLSGVEPADAVTNVDRATVFSTSAVADATYLFQFATGNNQTVVWTTSRSVSAAELARLGVGLTASAAYVWNVGAVHADGAAFSLDRTTYGGLASSGGRVSTVPLRSFTTTATP